MKAKLIFYVTVIDDRLPRKSNLRTIEQCSSHAFVYVLTVPIMNVLYVHDPQPDIISFCMFTRKITPKVQK